ncbi:hypothetical protein ACFVW1_47715 [Streptomyces olivochromogenes]|uniref:hypothetical protein n=1 Tax=Streptomyces olivochromogenes TaxID=1963 RepID=UPI0036DB6709
MAAFARSLRANAVPVPQIAQKLVIASGKNKGQRPSVATVNREVRRLASRTGT